MFRSIMTAGIATIALAGAANAATITVSATFDPATLTPFSLNNVAIDPVVIDAGDTLDITIAFLGGPVTIGAGSAIWFGLLASGDSDTLDTSSTISFTGGSANLLSSFGPLGQINEFVHVGSYFANALITTGGGDFSFTTANQLLDVISAPAGARGYERAFFYYETTATGGVIPEPATWGLMIAGFGLVGAAIRRRTAAIA